MPDPGPLETRRGISSLNRAYAYGPMSLVWALLAAALVFVLGHRFEWGEGVQQTAVLVIGACVALSHLLAGSFFLRVPREKRGGVGYLGMGAYLWGLFLLGVWAYWQIP